jgi:hypothetical protein
MATLASVQLVGKGVGVSCASPGMSLVLGVTGVATASIASAEASRRLSAYQKQQFGCRKRENGGEARKHAHQQRQLSLPRQGALPTPPTWLTVHQ